MPPRRGGSRHGRGMGGNPSEKPQNARLAWRRLLKELRPYGWWLLLEFVATALGTVASVAVPALLGLATDTIINRDFDQLVQYLILALVLSVISAGLLYLANRVNRLVVQRLAFKLRGDASSKINRLSVSYVESNDVGDLVSRTTNDVDNITQTLQMAIGRALESLFTVSAVLVMMFLISPWLALITLVVVPFSAVGATLIMRRSQPYFRKQWDKTGVVSTLVEESFSGQQILSLHGMTKGYAKKFEAENEEFTQASFKAQFISMLMRPMLMLLTNLSYVVIAVVGALFVLNGTMTIGAVQAFIQYSRDFSNPLAAVMQILNLMQSALASAERLFQFVDETDSPIETDGGETFNCGPNGTEEGSPVDCSGALAQGTIKFEDVTFSYVPGKPVIKHLNLTVNRGDSVAIAGPTGAGKTTLVNLLERYVDPDSGRITIGGLDIRRIPIEILRGEIGMVAQDPWLFEGTIAENISFGETSADSSEVREAARHSNLEPLVEALPEGFATEVDNESGSLSAGEKQLLTIARAFYARRPLMILDEATSAVDTRTEVLVAKALNRLGRGRTTFTIAHRLSTIRGADVILVMENGELVESGTHESLLAAKGAYYRLYSSQFKNG